ncbi:MAG: hypothetical protein QOI45_2496, partial [Thermoleophilaceae bacterium]|nr:hypothetical protein [Thermoleophilaceae bacterium]
GPVPTDDPYLRRPEERLEDDPGERPAEGPTTNGDAS